MAIRSDIQYIAHYVMRHVGVGTYSALTAGIGSTQVRVLNPEIFDPAGGHFINESADNFITYTAIQDDVLTGIPATGTGSVSATINPHEDVSASLLYVPDLTVASEVERGLDRYRKRKVVECIPDPDKKIYKANFGWLGTDYDLRDDNDDDFNSVTADTIDEETGEFIFTSARNEEKLYVASYFYDPDRTISDLLRSLILNERWSRYVAAGQLVRSGNDAGQIADIFSSLSQFNQ